MIKHLDATPIFYEAYNTILSHTYCKVYETFLWRKYVKKKKVSRRKYVANETEN